MVSTIHIRDISASDFDAVFTFVCGLEEQVFDRLQMQEHFLTCINLPYHIYLIAELDGKPAGYVSCHGQLLLHHCGRVYEIQELFVSQEFRGKKIGTALVSALEARLRATDCVLLEVASNMRRKEAHRFYESIGYDQTSYKFVKDLSVGRI